jgi:hypothetical protein
MIGLYVACMLFGIILIGVSLAGGHDGGHASPPMIDTDGDGVPDAHPGGMDQAFHTAADVAHKAGEAAAKAGSADPLWLPFLSLRFWSFFAAVFGITGTALWLIGLPDILSALITIPFGVGMGYAVSTLFMKLRTDQVSGETDLKRFVGQEARVMLPILPNDIGKIVIKGSIGRVEMPARTHDGHPIAPGANVLIASVENGVADVTTLHKALPGPES